MHDIERQPGQRLIFWIINYLMSLNFSTFRSFQSFSIAEFIIAIKQVVENIFGGDWTQQVLANEEYPIDVAPSPIAIHGSAR